MRQLSCGVWPKLLEGRKCEAAFRYRPLENVLLLGVDQYNWKFFVQKRGNIFRR